jgi:hypothetical protein
MHSPVDINSELERSLTPRSNPSIASLTPPPVTPVPSRSPPIRGVLSSVDYGLPQTLANEDRSPLVRDPDSIGTVVKLEGTPRDKGPRSSDGSTWVPMRSLSATSSSYSGHGIRSPARSIGALDRAMETLFEDTPLSPTTNASSSPLFPTKHTLPGGVENHNPIRDSSSKPPKLPTRSHTSPTIAKPRELDVLKPSKSVTSNSSASSSRSRKAKQCASCNKSIDDGRWIPMDGGRVLCDKCWKNMYLPKVRAIPQGSWLLHLIDATYQCRRCNLPIEKQAVSSSDGQLKGKYHRDCFSCHSCHVS